MEHIVNRLADSGFIPTARGHLSGAITLHGVTGSVVILTPVNGRVAVDLGEHSDQWSEAVLDESDVSMMETIRSAEPTAFLRTPSKRSYGRGGL
jgi:hypothetical protein